MMMAMAAPPAPPPLAFEAKSVPPPPALNRQQQQQQVQQLPLPTAEKVLQKESQPAELGTNNPHDENGDDVGSGVDYTKIPGALEKRFEAVDKEGAVRPTIINPGSTWTKRAQKALLAEPSTTSLGVDEQKSEKSRAFDLLDALSRSGGLSVDHASLHVVVAATHCFDRSLMDTIVKDNMNPIEKVERSTMVMASAIHGQPAEELVSAEHRGRLATITRI